MVPPACEQNVEIVLYFGPDSRRGKEEACDLLLRSLPGVSSVEVGRCFVQSAFSTAAFPTDDPT